MSEINTYFQRGIRYFFITLLVCAVCFTCWHRVSMPHAMGLAVAGTADLAEVSWVSLILASFYALTFPFYMQYRSKDSSQAVLVTVCKLIVATFITPIPYFLNTANSISYFLACFCYLSTFFLASIACLVIVRDNKTFPESRNSVPPSDSMDSSVQ